MVSRKENPGNFPTPEYLWPRVVGVIELPRDKGFLHGGLIIAENAGNEPDDRVRDDQRRKDAAGQNIVPDGNFIVHQMVGHALVHPLVMPAKKNEVPLSREFRRDFVRKPPSLRGEENHPCIRPAEIRERPVDGLDLHDHPGASPIWRVVRAPVPVGRPVAKVPRLELHEPLFLRPLEDALTHHGTADLGKDGEDLDFHDEAEQPPG